MDKIRTCVTLPPDLLAKLDAAADDQDRSRSWMVARAIDAFLDTQDSGRFSARQDGRQSESGPPKLTPTIGGGISLPRGRHSSEQDTRMDSTSSPILDTLNRQSAAKEDQARATQAARDVVHKQNEDYLAKLGKV